ncbi:CHY zinc finger domain protein [Ceratocystis lukuohia]|uniref:CHY zinc finger domain protein n=1 Tax=Ceratocystis lukuohia TaxID=2019550 RepID=A0ABR4MRM9_9PEZI
MASLVSEFIINPVLRQARRFSEISRPSVVDLSGGENEFPQKDVGSSLDPSAKDFPESAIDSATLSDDFPTSDFMSTSNVSPSLPPHVDPHTNRQPMSLLSAHIDGLNQSQEARALEDMSQSSSRSASPQLFVPLDAQGVCELEERELPDDDGMTDMRARIRSIQNMDVSTQEKGRLLHHTLMKSHLAFKACQSRQFASDIPDSTQTWQIQKNLAVGSPLSVGPLSTSLASLKFWNHEDEAETFTLTEQDITPTFYTPSNSDEPYIGCKHYRRNVKLQCSTCSKWYTCHGLGKDFFHCKYSHKCIERATDCNCPICEDYLFTSRKAVVFMECGHSIHRSCHDKYLATGSYKCPLCSKAIINTEALFRSIDLAIQNQPMPEEYSNTRALVFCHQCTTRTTVPFHWLALKCGLCDSFNTTHLETVSPPTGVQGSTEPIVAAPLASIDGVGGAAETMLESASASSAGQQADTSSQVTADDNSGILAQPETPNIQVALVQQAMTARTAAMRSMEDPVSPSQCEEILLENQTGPEQPEQTIPIAGPSLEAPIRELNADSVERFLQQFDQDLDQDILHLWDNDNGNEVTGSNEGSAIGVGAITRNALSTLQQAIHSNLLDNNDVASVASMTRNALNTFQQALQSRLDNNLDHELESAGNDESLRRNTLALLHHALHGNVVDSDDDADGEVLVSDQREPGEGDSDCDESAEDSEDDASSTADSLFAYEDPEDDFILPGHR